MTILIDKHCKVITQGITGKTGQFHTRACREYANGAECFVAGVHPKKAGQDFEGIPIYASVREARDATGATVSVIYVPPAGAAGAIQEAVEADLDLVICITEGIPVRDMVEVRYRMQKQKRKTILLGPNCPGVITPDELKIGIMPGHIHRAGSIGVVSRSGTLTYEAVAQLTELGLGQSTANRGGGDDRRNRRDGRGNGCTLGKRQYDQTRRWFHCRRYRSCWQAHGARGRNHIRWKRHG